MASAADVVKHYSTADIAPSKRLKVWNEYMSEVYYNLEVFPADKSKVRGEIENYLLDDVWLSSFSADAQDCSRRKSEARHDKDEFFVFIFPTANKMEFQQLGHSGIVGVDEVALLNSAESYETRIGDGSRNLTIKIPSSSIKEHVHNADRFLVVQNRFNNRLVPVVRHMGEQLIGMPGGVRADRFRDGLVDLVALMLELSGDNSASEILNPNFLELTYRRLMHFMRARLGDATLSPVMVAVANKISLRYLHKAFAACGTSFGKELMDMRLTEAHRLLVQATNTDGRTPNIGRVAEACGFSSQAHFSARYREKYGYSPRETTGS